jgi:ATP-dependent Clp protease ATP-binding subunit ClpB
VRKLRLELDSVPEEVDKLDRQLRQLEIEREAIKRENDTREKLDAMNKQIEDLRKTRQLARQMDLGKRDRRGYSEMQAKTGRIPDPVPAR